MRFSETVSPRFSLGRYSLSCLMSEGGLCRAGVGGEPLHPGPAGQGEGFLVTYRSSSFTQRRPDGPYNNSFWMFDRSTRRIEMLEASRVNSRPRASLQPRRVCAGGRRKGEVSVGSLDQQEDPAHAGTWPRVSLPWPPPATCIPSRMRSAAAAEGPVSVQNCACLLSELGGHLTSEKQGCPSSSEQTAWGSERGPRLLLREGGPWVSLLSERPGGSRPQGRD